MILGALTNQAGKHHQFITKTHPGCTFLALWVTLKLVTTQVVLDCEATCGPSVCGIYFNTNLTNLSNCAGLTSNKETIRFVFL